MQSTLSTMASGSIAGTVSVIAGAPFDLVKVRLQTAAASSTTGQALRAMRPSHLFVGSGPAIASAVLENSVVFAANTAVKNQWLALTNKHERELSNTELAAFGAAAGVFSATAITPAEMIKVRLQASAPGVFKGGLDCLRRTVQGEGAKALFRGLPAQLARDVPFNLVFFAGYENAVSGVQAMRGAADKRELHPFDFALAGGLAGALGWTVTLPMDLVKSRAQASKLGAEVRPMELSLRIARGIYRESGARGFFRGWTAAVARSFPVNGALFMTFEFVNAASQRGL